MIRTRFSHSLITFLIVLIAYDHALGQESLVAKHLNRSQGSLTLEESSRTIAIKQNSNNILVYNKESPPAPEGMKSIYERSGFLHPVSSPDGNVVTAAFPIDHPHQHGIFTAWVRTRWKDRKIDFWNLADGTGRVLHERTVASFSGDHSVGFEVDLLHRSVQSPEIDILRERWRITAWETDGSYHCFDLETKQENISTEALFIDRYHYGGVAYRGPVSWLSKKDSDQKNVSPSAGVIASESSSMLNDLGGDQQTGNHQRAKWVAVSGTIQGKPTTIVVLSHQSNFRAPQPARLHPTKPYFAFSPCVDEDFAITAVSPYKARYRYLITDKVPDVAWTQRKWDEWNRVGTSDPTQ